MRIDYSLDPNVFSVAKVAQVLTATFTEPDEPRHDIAQACYDFLRVFQVNHFEKATKQELKAVKKKLMADFSRACRGETVANAHLRCIQQADFSELGKLNILCTLCRWPEWYIEPESLLNRIVHDLPDHKSEINAITYYNEDGRICPYDPLVKDNDRDIYQTLHAQSSSVEDYCRTHGINSLISADNVIEELKSVEINLLSGNRVSKFESGFMESLRCIRMNIASVVRKMDRILRGDCSQDDYGLSESRSVLSDYDAIMQYLHQYGWNKGSCPNVLSNMFHAKYPFDFRKSLGQLQLDLEAGYFQVAAGLGPAKKIRFVFNIIQEIQNLLSPLADLIQKADLEFDLQQESYLDQLTGLVQELPIIEDAYCIDSTGYSDYLTRAVYSYLLRLYGLPERLIDIVMQIFAFPLKIGTEKVPVRFGSMQGCKLLVFIMNHANRLMGILTRRLSINEIDNRHNAGDDVVSIAWEDKINISNIHNEMKVFALFNCPTNESKSAWLKRDGYFDFCSKYFAKVDSRVQYVGGIPPKLIGKQFTSIKMYVEIFKILDKVSYPYRDPAIVLEECKSTLYPELELGLALPNSIDKQWKLDEKIEAAKGYPVELGGLSLTAAADPHKAAQQALALFERILLRYRFRPNGIYLLAQKLIDDKSELYLRLGSVEKLSMSEIMTHLQTLREAVRYNTICYQDVKEAGKFLTKLEKNFLSGLSSSSSQSTYHRITATKDLDSFLTDEELDTELSDKFTVPEDQLSMSMILEAELNDKYTTVDNIRRYIRLQIVTNRIRNRLEHRSYGGYPNWYIMDDDRSWIKLTTKDRCSPDSFGYQDRDSKMKSRSLIINADVREFVKLVDGDYQMIWDIYYHIDNVYNTAMRTLEKKLAARYLEKANATLLVNRMPALRRLLESQADLQKHYRF